MSFVKVRQSQAEQSIQSLPLRVVGWVKRNVLFALVVVVPTIGAMVYYSVASDVYISSSKFVVRSPQKTTATGLGALLQSSGFIRSQDDVYAVQDYMASRDAASVLNHDLDLKKIYGNSSIDIFNRYGVFGHDTFEQLNKYFEKKIHLSLDSSSSIVTLEVRAYSAADATKVNERLLELSEELVNRINERGRSDQVQYAQEEVDRAKSIMDQAANALAEYRNKQHIFDTDKQSALQLQQVTKLQDQLTSTVAQISQIKAVAPDNPQIPVLENLRQTLQSQINQQMSGVAGGAASLSSHSSDYQKLMLDNSLAEKQLAAAMASLDEARNDAQRKEVYIERIAQPNTPDEALEPERLKGVFAVLLFSLVLWAVLGMFIASVKEHRE